LGKYAIIILVSKDPLLHASVRKEVILIELKEIGMTRSQLLFGKYQIEEQIGKGGFSRVYRCRHVTMDLPVAVKQVEISNVTESIIQHESEILKILKHPGIPTLYDIQKDEKYYYLIEEFFDGEVLSKYAKKEKLNSEIIGKILLSLIDILCYLHQLPDPVLYLDLQPDNILICKEQVALIDFGNAVQKGEQRQQRFFHGTPGFAAPEQYYGEAEERSDIYGLGAVLYFLLYQKAPGGSEQAGKESSFPLVYAELLHGSMKHRKEERFRTMEELKRAFQCLMEKQIGSRDSSLTITFAGSVQRIGVTHISLAFAEYLGRQGLRVLYREENDSGAIQSIANADQLEADGGAYQFPHFQAFPYYYNMVQEPEEKYDVIVRDFGVLTEEKNDLFEKGDGCFLVLGVKPWEQREWKAFWKRENRILLFNFSSTENYHHFLNRIIRKKEGKENCFRVPMFLDYQKPDEAAEKFFLRLYRIFWEEGSKKGRWRFWEKRTGVHKRQRKP